MILYLSIIFVAMVIISVLNIFLGADTFANYEIWIVCAVTLSVIVEIAICGLMAFIFERVPDSKYNLNSKFFNISKRERRFYEKIGIKSWKDKVWELGALGGFRKNKIKDPNSSEYLHKFMIESCKGMVGHIANFIAAFLVIFILPIRYWWRIGLPVALVGVLLNLLPTLILRYNLPKLDVAYRRARRLEERAENKVEAEKLEEVADNK